MSILKAVLGPTNTGKTHYAIERMLGHASGMIGLPLRLLAREVYDKVVAQKGVTRVALITGEERIWPPRARYFICTVEAMPLDVEVDCLVIDEVQLAADPDRGHVFTDRLLHARGRAETLLLGADTIAPILHALDVGAVTESRERFSELQYIGPVKVTRLPKRSAIVAFSADEVYAIGELLRRKKGGAAIVMGALSPRTRNAQVDLYQSGEVDYLVATDAIGMGLNLDVDHIAFAASAKFDGRRRRALTPAEMAQIAGRAGRFRSHGTFGETASCSTFLEDVVGRIEEHHFAPLERLEWRNSDLDYSSLSRLMGALAKPSGNIILKQNPSALDEWVLRRMAIEPGLEAEARGARRVRRLWDLCRLPDFRKAGHEGHFRLVQSLYDQLADPEARLSDQAMENRLQRLRQAEGDIPALQTRLAAIRTWTYAANRDDWLENAMLWREKTREIEDRLSDALHMALTARFVDRRTTALLAGLDKDEALMGELTDAGEVTVEGHVVGHLRGLLFEPVSTAKTLEGKAVRGAALAVLRPLLLARLAEIVQAEEGAFTLSPSGEVWHKGAPVAQVKKGADWLQPALSLIGAREVEVDTARPALARLTTWLTSHIAGQLPTHMRLKAGDGDGLTGYARGLAFRLQESGAAIDLRQDDPSQRLEPDHREALKALGIRAGRVAAHIPDAQKPAAQRLISCLQSLFSGMPIGPAPEGAGSFPLDGAWTDEALLANGYLRFGPRAVRADLAERLAWEVSKRRREAAKSAFALPPELASIVSCPGGEFPALLKGLGLTPAEKGGEDGETITLWRYRSKARIRPGSASGAKPKRHPPARPGRRANAFAHAKPHGPAPRRNPDPDSPFAALAGLIPEAPVKPKRQKPKRKKTEHGKTHTPSDGEVKPEALTRKDGSKTARSVKE